MIRGFIDDSEQEEVFVLAGWVTDYQTWELFTEKWRAVLDEPPAIKYFKHHEAKGEPPRGEFEGWPETDIATKMQKLTEVICGHPMYGAISGVNLEVYKSAFADSIVPLKVLRTFMKNTHHFKSCVYSMSAMILQIEVDRGNTEDRVDLVFDENEGLMSDCIAFYNSIKEHLPEAKRNIAGTITQANDKDVEALQAADFLAGQFTIQRRLGYAETYYRQMDNAHLIADSPAYMPSFEDMPKLIAAFNVWWATTQTERAKKKGLK